jgi:hypothetical protein
MQYDYKSKYVKINNQKFNIDISTSLRFIYSIFNKIQKIYNESGYDHYRFPHSIETEIINKVTNNNFIDFNYIFEILTSTKINYSNTIPMVRRISVE